MSLTEHALHESYLQAGTILPEIESPFDRALVDDRTQKTPLASDRAQIEKALVRIRQTSASTRNRTVTLRLALAGLEGLTFDEAASVVGVRPRVLAKWLRETDSIPRSREGRIREVHRMLWHLTQVVEPRNVGRWFHLPIPALGGRTPLQAIEDRKFDAVAEVARAYTDPSFG